MDVVLTEVANRQLEQLPGADRRQVIEALRKDLPAAVSSDERLELKTLDSELRVHKVSADVRVLYRVSDVDHDDEDEVVVFAIVTHADLPVLPEAAMRSGVTSEGLLGSSTKIGREVISKLTSDAEA
jgi:mRNA-degrading endonuclease RelE of RelBE toxin-antitoxin system